MLDLDGALWLLGERAPVKVDVSQWNGYVIIARGNHLIHQFNGQVTSELFDPMRSGARWKACSPSSFIAAMRTALRSKTSASKSCPRPRSCPSIRPN